MKKTIKEILDSALGITEGSTQLAAAKKKKQSLADNAVVPFRKIGNTVIAYRETKFESIKLVDEGVEGTKLTYTSKETKETQAAIIKAQDILLENLDTTMPQDDQLWC